MRELEIRTWVKQLGKSFGSPRPVADVALLRERFERRAYTEMIGLIRDSMGLQALNLRVGYVNSGGPKTAPAWIQMPMPMPLLNTSAFRKLQLTMFLRKEFIERAGFPVLLMPISHEMAHVILNSTMHELRRVEEVVDLTAMFFGYRHAYITSNTLEEPEASLDTEMTEKLRQMFGSGFHFDVYSSKPVGRLGYLTIEERRFAAQLMGATQPIT